MSTNTDPGCHKNGCQLYGRFMSCVVVHCISLLWICRVNFQTLEHPSPQPRTYVSVCGPWPRRLQRTGGRALNLHAGLFDCLLVYFSCSHTYRSIGEDFPTWLNQCRQRTYAWPLAHNGYIGRVTIGRPPTADLPIHAMLDWLKWGHMV